MRERDRSGPRPPMESTTREEGGGRAGAAMYCPPCRERRAIADWRGRGDALAITLAPCGHVVERAARLEWRVPTRAEARAARLAAAAGPYQGGRRKRRAAVPCIGVLA